jgi:thioester reductase-like protein
LAALLSGSTQSGEKHFNLQDEIELDDSVKIDGLPKADIEQPKAILLTGTTGFVGAFMLEELLAQTGADIYCLVRADSTKKGRERIKQQLQDFQLYDEESFRRVVPVIGDLSRPLLGLSQSEFDSLADTIDMIFHNGAWVNHVYSYDLLRDANVGGTHELLKLATQKKLKAIQHISIGTCQMLQDQHFEQHNTTPHFGYVLTKFVAEKIIHAAGDRGVPVCVHRLPIISGDAHTGVWNSANRVRKLIEGCIMLGYAPDAEGLSEVCGHTLTPVDFVKQFIIKAALQQDSIGKTFDIINPESVDWSELVVAMQDAGYAVGTVSLDEWKAKLIETAKRYPDNKAYETLVGLYVHEHNSIVDPDADANFDQDEVNKAMLSELDKLGMDQPVVDRGVFKAYIDHSMGEDVEKAVS